MKTYLTSPSKALDIRAEVLDALQEVSDIVCSTMGPGGRNVTIHSQGGIITTKDGVTVARYLNFEDKIKNLIAMMAIDAASKTVKEVGDGTTTSVLLVNAIYKNLVQVLKDVPEANLFHVAKGVDEAVTIVRNALHAAAFPIKEDNGAIIADLLRDVAVISANNDEILGRLIANAVISVGENGTLDVKESLDGSTYVEKLDGYVFPTIALRSFIPQGKSKVELENPIFFIADYKFSTYDEIQPIVHVWKENCFDANKKLRPLVMIVSDIEGSALSTMIVNSAKMPICVVKAPHFQGARMDMLNDIALVTQTRQVFATTTGHTIDRFGFQCENNKEIEFGQALRFVLHKDKAEIVRASAVSVGVDDDGIKELVAVNLDELVAKRVVDLKESLLTMEHEGERRVIKDRISRLSSGMGIVYVGADSDIELNYKRMVIDDTIRACFTALDGGVVVGGGNALAKCYSVLQQHIKYAELDEDSDEHVETSQTLGMAAILKSLDAPMKYILKNMFVDGTTIDTNVSLLKFDVSLKELGFNLAVNGIDDLYDAGILDPVKVTESALKNAASVAKQLLLTDWFLMLEESKEVDLGKLLYPER